MMDLGHGWGLVLGTWKKKLLPGRVGTYSTANKLEAQYVQFFQESCRFGINDLKYYPPWNQHRPWQLVVGTGGTGRLTFRGYVSFKEGSFLWLSYFFRTDPASMWMSTADALKVPKSGHWWEWIEFQGPTMKKHKVLTTNSSAYI